VRTRSAEAEAKFAAALKRREQTLKRQEDMSQGRLEAAAESKRVQEKTARLRALRLAKEAADLALPAAVDHRRSTTVRRARKAT